VSNLAEFKKSGVKGQNENLRRPGAGIVDTGGIRFAFLSSLSLYGQSVTVDVDFKGNAPDL
jgi:hypothetical protein